MSENRSLGQLQTVPLRDFWQREDTEFTPWLADPENIGLLGSVLGLELEVDDQEVTVGNFRADIVCRATDGSIVLIENQLETTNHAHLGQLFTYAAGLDAVTVVWIASRFTDEHRAAVDWLNKISHEPFNFFALEIELLRIGESKPAPRFNIVAKPNNWSDKIIDELSPGSARTELQRLTVEYWSAFGDYLKSMGSKFNPPKPSPSYWMGYGIGKTGYLMSVLASMRDKFIGTEFVITATNANELFDGLYSEKDSIHAEMSFEMDWHKRPEQKQCNIQIRLEIDTTERSNWPEMHRWTLDHMTAVDKAFRPRISALP